MLYIHTVLCFSFTIHQIKCHIYISFQRWFVLSNAFVFSYQQNASNNCVCVYILFYFQQQHCGYHREVIVDWWRQLAAILFMPQWVSLRYGYTDMREQMARICGLIGFPHSKVHGANMGPIWGRQDPGGPHVGPMKLAIWVGLPFTWFATISIPQRFTYRLTLEISRGRLSIYKDGTMFTFFNTYFLFEIKYHYLSIIVLIQHRFSFVIIAIRAFQIISP